MGKEELSCAAHWGWVFLLAASGCHSTSSSKPDTTTDASGIPESGVLDSGLTEETSSNVEPDAPGDSPGEARSDADVVSESELRRIVGMLASNELTGRDEGTPGGILARNYLVNEMKACHLEPVGVSGFEQPITTGVGANLLGRIAGSDSQLADRYIVLGAHYDHLGQGDGGIYSGAYDNAAAVAAALQVACAMSEKPGKRSILVALWDAEEPPTFITDKMGSQFWVKHPTIPLAKIDVAIALDLIGEGMWPGSTWHFVLGSELSKQVRSVVDRLPSPTGIRMAKLGLHVAEEKPGGREPWSDYDSFRNERIPILFPTDGQNKHYHQFTDKADTIEYGRLAAETKLVLETVRGLVDLAEQPVFDPNGADYTNDAVVVEALAKDALAPGGMALSQEARAKMEQDYAAVKAVAESLVGGEAASQNDVAAIRKAAQRALCLAGTDYEEAVCLKL